MGVGQQIGGLLEAHIADKLTGCLIGQLLHLAIEMHTTDAHLVGQLVDIEILVGQVVVDDMHHSLQQFIIRIMQFHFLDLFLHGLMA